MSEYKNGDRHRIRVTSHLPYVWWLAAFLAAAAAFADDKPIKDSPVNDTFATFSGLTACS